MLQPWKVPLLETPLRGDHGNTAWPGLIPRDRIVTCDKRAIESRKLSQTGIKPMPTSLHLYLSSQSSVSLSSTDVNLVAGFVCTS